MNMNKRKKPKVWIVILILVIACISPVLLNQQGLLAAKKKEMRDIQNKIAEEKKVNEELQRKKKILNTDEYNEKVAREAFGMIKSGDKVYIDVNK